MKKKTTEPPLTLTLYVDGVDWQHELGEAADGTTFYPSFESLKKYSKCWEECGVLKVMVTFSNPEWIIQGRGAETWD